MKRTSLIILCLSLGTLACLRGEQRDAPPPDKRRPGPPENRGNSERPAPPPPVRDYLDQLKASDPEAFNRLEKLREEDPQAFRNELRKNAWGRKEGGKSRHGNRPHPLQVEIDNIKSAETEEARQSAVAELRVKLTERVENNLKERELAIEKFRQKLKELEEQNEQEQIRREEIIDHHLQRILENLSSPPPSHE